MSLRAAALLAGAIVLGASPARADVQWSARQASGLGAALGEHEDELLLELGLRTEVLFGAPGDEHARVGPAIEVRSVDFAAVSLSAGAAVLIPTWRGYPIVLSALAGYDFREGPDAPVGVGTFFWGFRGYDFHDFYGHGIGGYVSTRFDLDRPGAWQITFGVEVDLEFLWLIPALAARMLIAGRGDPDEPEQNGDE